MHQYLKIVEKQLCSFISTNIVRKFHRTVTDDCIILSTNYCSPLSVYIYSDTICINFADEYSEFDLGKGKKYLTTLDYTGSFINELMTGALIYERIYYGNVQTRCRVILVNKITKREINIRETDFNLQHLPNAPKLVLHEKVFFA